MFDLGQLNEDEEYDEPDWSESIRTAFKRSSMGCKSLKGAKLGRSPIFNKQIARIFPNLMPEETNQSLYRIDSLDHFLIMLLQKQMILVQPELWPDPWEDPILRYSETVDTKLKKRFSCFAQCWSYNPACAALWKDSRNKGRAVQIETTVTRMLDGISCRDSRCFDAEEQFFLKPVEYLSDKESKSMRAEIEEQWNNDNLPPYDFEDCRLALLFQKRCAFKHEKEIRLVWRMINTSSEDHSEMNSYDEIRISPKDHIISVPIDSKILVKSVQVDPWCEDEEYQIIENVLNNFGIPCAKSDLASPMWK